MLHNMLSKHAICSFVLKIISLTDNDISLCSKTIHDIYNILVRCFFFLRFVTLHLHIIKDSQNFTF